MDLSIRELARHCGFRSQNHLAHLFQKHTGRSPSQYRRLLRLKGRT
jgi:AraC-like DNA-binding protein